MTDLVACPANLVFGDEGQEADVLAIWRVGPREALDQVAGRRRRRIVPEEQSMARVEILRRQKGLNRHEVGRRPPVRAPVDVEDVSAFDQRIDRAAGAVEEIAEVVREVGRVDAKALVVRVHDALPRSVSVLSWTDARQAATDPTSPSRRPRDLRGALVHRAMRVRACEPDRPISCAVSAKLDLADISRSWSLAASQSFRNVHDDRDHQPERCRPQNADKNTQATRRGLAPGRRNAGEQADLGVILTGRERAEL